MRRFSTRSGRIAALAAAVALLLAGCGGSSGGSASGAGSASAAGTPTVRPTGGPGAFGAQFPQIQACLKAAGISLPTPSGMPSGVRPSGLPAEVPPSGMPSAGPGGMPGEGRGGLFQSAEVRAALAACGITLPTARPTAG